MMKLFSLIAVLTCLFVKASSFQFYFNCDDKPCQNGVCIELYQNTAYKCECEPGWEGVNCDQSLNGEATESFTEQNKILYPVTKQNNNCRNKCRNGGTCNERTNTCLCQNKYHGKFCEKKNYVNIALQNDQDVKKDFNMFEDCDYSCVHKEFSNGYICPYRHYDTKKTCKCDTAQKKCIPMMNFLNDCRMDCRSRLKKGLNVDQVCPYVDEETKSKAMTCKCVNNLDWCEPVLDNGMQSSLFRTIMSMLSFIFFVALFYAARLLFVNFLEMLSNGTCNDIFNSCCPKRRREHRNSTDAIEAVAVDTQNSTELEKLSKPEAEI